TAPKTAITALHYPAHIRDYKLFARRDSERCGADCAVWLDFFVGSPITACHRNEVGSRLLDFLDWHRICRCVCYGDESADDGVHRFWRDHGHGRRYEKNSRDTCSHFVEPFLHCLSPLRLNSLRRAEPKLPCLQNCRS